MNEKLQVFHSNQFGDLQTLIVDGKVLFRASQVAEKLGYLRPSDAVKQHCKGSAKYRVPTNGGMQEVYFIPEGDLYRLIFRSKLPLAQRFESWVVDKILPTIRKQGFYVDPQRILDPDVIIQLANRVKELQAQLSNQTEQNQILSQQVEELKPKANYYDLILSCPDPISVTEIAQDYGFTAVEFNRLLKRLKVQHYLPLRKVWVLNKKFLGFGYTRILPLQIDSMHVKHHMYWTQKGRLFLYNLLKENGIYPDIEKMFGDDEIPY